MIPNIIGISIFGIAIIWTVVYRGQEIKERIQDRFDPIDPMPVARPVWDVRTDGSFNDVELTPGTKVVFPGGHYIITRPAAIETSGYGRMLNKPSTPIPGYTYTI